MKQYDYKMLTISVPHLSKEKFRSELADKLTKYGSQGWEMLKLEPIQGSHIFHIGPYTSDFLVVFKKEIN